jgi:hypothetical protein
MNSENSDLLLLDFDRACSCHQSETGPSLSADDDRASTSAQSQFSNVKDSCRFVSYYKNVTDSTNTVSSFFQKPGTLAFFEFYFGYANKKAFDYIHEYVRYSDIKTIIVVLNPPIIWSAIYVLLDSGKTLAFGLRHRDGQYLSKNLLIHSGDTSFPFEIGIHSDPSKRIENALVFVKASNKSGEMLEALRQQNRQQYGVIYLSKEEVQAYTSMFGIIEKYTPCADAGFDSPLEYTYYRDRFLEKNSIQLPVRQKIFNLVQLTRNRFVSYIKKSYVPLTMIDDVSAFDAYYRLYISHFYESEFVDPKNMYE